MTAGEITKDMFEWLQYMVKSGYIEQMREHLDKIDREIKGIKNQLTELLNKIK